MLGSNYTQQRAPHGQSVTIPFSQPPTITHTAPPLVAFNFTAGFVYEFETASVLGQQLGYGQLQSTPSELSANVSVTVFPHEVGARVMGRISIEQTLPLILQQEGPPSLSITISDALGGVVIARTQLRINPSPPLFDRSDYVFSLNEGSGRGTFLGPIRLIDPNGGDTMLIPTIIPAENQSSFFSIVPSHLSSPEQDSNDAFSSFQLLVLVEPDYERMQVERLRLQVVDRDDPFLTSTATVTVNIMPVNEFSPTFVTNRYP